ncbi:MAG: sigma-70 family RNA polymerase sigma factor [Oscillospiraceae bacterium]|nr:sigma-70 family RNA polymerase sigma factor [Oscillospiraceae bacterium]
MDDVRIVEMLWKRDDGALSALKARHERLILSVAQNLLKNREDSEECLNDTLFAAWNAIPPAKPENLGTFVCKIARNLSLKKWRERTAKKRGGGSVYLLISELDDCISDGKTVDEAIDQKALAETVDSFLRTLDADERDLFILRYFYFYSVASLAEKFGFSKSKVKTQLYRTRQKLSIRLEKEGVIV